jgi:hypothetical protein
MAYIRLLLLMMMIVKCVSEQTAIISPYGINKLVFRVEMECVYCAVRTDSHNCSWCMYLERYLAPLRVDTCIERDGSSKVGQHPRNHYTHTHTQISVH